MEKIFQDVSISFIPSFIQILVLRRQIRTMQITCNAHGGSCKRVWLVSLPWVAVIGLSDSALSDP